MDEEEMFYEIQTRIHKHMVQLLEEGASPMQIAGVMAASAVTIYKNLLDDDEFLNLMDSIVQTAASSGISEKQTIH